MPIASTNFVEGAPALLSPLIGSLVTDETGKVVATIVAAVVLVLLGLLIAGVTVGTPGGCGATSRRSRNATCAWKWPSALKRSWRQRAKERRRWTSLLSAAETARQLRQLRLH